MRTAVAVVVLLTLGILTGCVTVRVPSEPAPNQSAPGGDGQGGGGGGRGGGDGFSFVHTRKGGAPVRWSTCEPIRYVVRPHREPEGGRELIRDSVERISEVTGLEFSFAGTTSEAPKRNRQPYHPNRYGDRWSPVLVAWSTPKEFPRLKGQAAGFGGPIMVRRSGAAPRYVSGTAVLDVEQLQGMSEEGRRAVVLHELAHVVGLAHVNDRSQLMNPVQYGRGVTDLQQGDLAGLRRLGNGKCYDPIQPRRFGG